MIETPADLPIDNKSKSKRFTGDRIAPARAYAIRALVESGMTKKEIAKREHISPNTIRAIQKSDKFDPQRVEHIKQNLAANWYQTADRAINAITDAKLEQSTALQLGTLGAISTDKARLIEGKATVRTEYVDSSDQAINDEIARLEGELAQWKSGDIVNSEGIELPLTTSAGQPASQTVDQGSDSAE